MWLLYFFLEFCVCVLCGRVFLLGGGGRRAGRLAGGGVAWRQLSAASGPIDLDAPVHDVQDLVADALAVPPAPDRRQHEAAPLLRLAARARVRGRGRAREPLLRGRQDPRLRVVVALPGELARGRVAQPDVDVGHGLRDGPVALERARVRGGGGGAGVGARRGRRRMPGQRGRRDVHPAVERLLEQLRGAVVPVHERPRARVDLGVDDGALEARAQARRRRRQRRVVGRGGGRAPGRRVAERQGHVEVAPARVVEPARAVGRAQDEREARQPRARRDAHGQALQGHAAAGAQKGAAERLVAAVVAGRRRRCRRRRRRGALLLVLLVVLLERVVRHGAPALAVRVARAAARQEGRLARLARGRLDRALGADGAGRARPLAAAAAAAALLAAAAARALGPRDPPVQHDVVRRVRDERDDDVPVLLPGPGLLVHGRRAVGRRGRAARAPLLDDGQELRGRAGAAERKRAAPARRRVERGRLHHRVEGLAGGATLALAEGRRGGGGEGAGGRVEGRLLRLDEGEGVADGREAARLPQRHGRLGRRRRLLLLLLLLLMLFLLLLPALALAPLPLLERRALRLLLAPPPLALRLGLVAAAQRRVDLRERLPAAQARLDRRARGRAKVGALRLARGLPQEVGLHGHELLGHVDGALVLGGDRRGSVRGVGGGRRPPRRRRLCGCPAAAAAAAERRADHVDPVGRVGRLAARDALELAQRAPGAQQRAHLGHRRPVLRVGLGVAALRAARVVPAHPRPRVAQLLRELREVALVVEGRGRSRAVAGGGRGGVGARHGGDGGGRGRRDGRRHAAVAALVLPARKHRRGRELPPQGHAEVGAVVVPPRARGLVLHDKVEGVGRLVAGQHDRERAPAPGVALAAAAALAAPRLLLRLERRLQRAVLVRARAPRARPAPGEAPPALVPAPALDAPMQQGRGRGHVGSDAHDLLARGPAQDGHGDLVPAAQGVGLAQDRGGGGREGGGGGRGLGGGGGRGGGGRVGGRGERALAAASGGGRARAAADAAAADARRAAAAAQQRGRGRGGRGARSSGGGGGGACGGCCRGMVEEGARTHIIFEWRPPSVRVSFGSS